MPITNLLFDTWLKYTLNLIVLFSIVLERTNALTKYMCVAAMNRNLFFNTRQLKKGKKSRIYSSLTVDWIHVLVRVPIKQRKSMEIENVIYQKKKMLKKNVEIEMHCTDCMWYAKKMK